MRYEEIQDIINLIIDELKRQEDKWGIQDHHPEKWMNILMEEVGEASEAVLEAFPFKIQLKDREYWLNRYYLELRQVAAVAISAMDCLDRNFDKLLEA